MILDRDDHVVVNWENIQFSRQDAFQKLPFNLVSEDVMDVPYDVRSGKGFKLVLRVSRVPLCEHHFETLMSTSLWVETFGSIWIWLDNHEKGWN